MDFEMLDKIHRQPERVINLDSEDEVDPDSNS